MHFPILAISLIAQVPDPDIQGTVVEASGAPAAGAVVVVYRESVDPPVLYVGSATTDGQGGFRLWMPQPQGSRRGITYNGNRVHYFAHRKGAALAVIWPLDESRKLVLREAAPRVVTVQSAKGKPVPGVKVMPRLIRFAGGSIAEIPLELAFQLAATTGPDGKATLDSLAAWDELMAVRIAGEPVAGQDVVLADRPGQPGSIGPVTITFMATTGISGRVVDEHGHGLAGQEVEIWTRGGLVYPSPVEFAGGPVRTGPDGSFRTPQSLLAGSTFRVVVQGPGKDLIVGDWLLLGPEPREVPEIAFGLLRTIRGRVVDRAGKPVAGAEVLQRGDGPEPTRTQADGDGKFSLGGFRPRPAILFARKAGYRFHGQLVRPNEADVTVVLARHDEPDDKGMKLLPYPEMPPDARAIARRLIEPVLEAALRRNDSLVISRAMRTLASADPTASLEKLDSEKRIDVQTRDGLRYVIISDLAETDPEAAADLAEALPSADRSVLLLVLIARAIPSSQRAKKLELLDRALIKTRAVANVAEKLRIAAAVANAWCDLGEVEKARKLVMETLPVAREYAEKSDVYRGFFASALARFDLPAALAMADELGGRDKDRIKGLIAIRLAAVDPAESEKLWSEWKVVPFNESLEGCYRLALSAPERARRIAALHAKRVSFDYYMMLALGLASRDRVAASAAFHDGLGQVDALMDSPHARFGVNGFLLTALECVDRIDPALATDVFWRYLAMRPSSVNPRNPAGPTSILMFHLVARYDRHIARILFEPTRARISHAKADALEGLEDEFGTWTILDPTGAIAAVEKLPIDPSREDSSGQARLGVAAALCRKDWRRRFNFLR
jgi:hypothetical protein